MILRQVLISHGAEALREQIRQEEAAKAEVQAAKAAKAAAAAAAEAEAAAAIAEAEAAATKKGKVAAKPSDKSAPVPETLPNATSSDPTAIETKEDDPLSPPNPVSLSKRPHCSELHLPELVLSAALKQLQVRACVNFVRI